MPNLLAEVYDYSSLPRKGCNIALTYEQFRKLLSKWVTMTGTDAKGYTPHFLHSRGMSHALNADLAGVDMHLMGD